MSTATRKFNDALLTDVHLAEIRSRAKAKAHPNDVLTDEQVARDLDRAEFAEDGALVVTF